jgi:anti-sigma factor RsiW
MDSCLEFRPELGTYVLGAISPQDREALVRHLTSCPACRDELAAMAALPGLLRRARPAADPVGSPRPPDRPEATA